MDYILHDGEKIIKVYHGRDNLDVALAHANDLDCKVLEYEIPIYPPVSHYSIENYGILAHFYPVVIG
jgi:hypothetical protein